MNNLKVFKSSAGSGKTFTLVKEYLKLALAHPGDYKAILAITFTNKAAEEMKNRIIETLVSLSNGEKSSMLTLLSEELPAVPIQKNASKCLKNILHDYSSFSVSTIDSFFYRILRSLAREIHLPLNLEVQINTDDAVLEVTDRLLLEVGVDKELTEWLTNLAIQKMDDDKGWYIEPDIRMVAEEIIKEGNIEDKTLSRDEIKKLYNQLLSIREAFEKKMQSIGKKALAWMEKYSLTIEDFAYGKSGVANYFNKISQSYCSDYVPGNRAKDALTSIEKWSIQKHPRKSDILSIAEQHLVPLLSEASLFVEEKFRDFITANEILKKIYLFGIVNDIQKKFSEYRHENNTILLADTTRLLSEIIEDNDAPFVYEKAGNKFKHLLIDEFQDTSLLQWKNLLPLVINALGSGCMTLVVGDAKQSIYRWRGGNMNLLIRDIFIDLKNFEELFIEEVLDTNYRSKKEIVDFNNSFFENATKVINREVEMDKHQSLELAYGKDLLQAVAEHNNTGGYVNVEFLSDDDEESEEEEAVNWKDQAKNKLLATVNDLLKKKYSYRDIAILVRKNSEGNELATFLLSNGIDKIISPDSLLINTSPKIGFVINVFRFLANTRNAIAKSEVIYYYGRFIQATENHEWHLLFSDHKFGGRRKTEEGGLFDKESLKNNLFNQLLPEEFSRHVSELGRLPVYELSEQILRIFKLNDKPDAYLQRFQDLILEYTASLDSSLDGFLTWWDSSTKVRNCSVIVPSNENAIRIMTLHRSKGLQFPIVFMPFTEWSILPKANDIVWMETDQPPFEQLGKVALASSNKLLDSHFQVPYRNEIKDSVIDNLNLLYVGFTRAEHKLFIYTRADKGKDLNKISKLISRTLNPENAERIEKGTNDIRPKMKEKTDGIVSEELRYYQSHPWQEKLALKTHSKDLLEMLGENALNPVNYGNLVHQLLAGISTKNEVKVSAQKMIFDGLISSPEAEQLIREVSDVLNDEKIASFFDVNDRVMAEKEMILQGGEILRPDRVIFRENEVLVIDFKTGKREKKHEDQIRRYASVLKEMNEQNVSSYLIYLHEKAVVRVD